MGEIRSPVKEGHGRRDCFGEARVAARPVGSVLQPRAYAARRQCKWHLSAFGQGPGSRRETFGGLCCNFMGMSGIGTRFVDK